MIAYSVSPQQNVSTLASDNQVTSTTTTPAERVSGQKTSTSFGASVCPQQTPSKESGLKSSTETGACIGGQEHHKTKRSAADSGRQVATTSAVVSSGDQHISTTTGENSSPQMTSATTGESSDKQKPITSSEGSEKGIIHCLELSASH